VNRNPIYISYSWLTNCSRLTNYSGLTSYSGLTRYASYILYLSAAALPVFIQEFLTSSVLWVLIALCILLSLVFRRVSFLLAVCFLCFSHFQLDSRINAQLSEELESKELWLTGEVIWTLNGSDDVDIKRFELRINSARFTAKDSGPVARVGEKIVKKMPALAENERLKRGTNAEHKGPQYAVLNSVKHRSVRLSWKGFERVELGEQWQLLVRMRRPRGFVNPKGFDYQAWQLARGLSASGYVRKSPENRRIAIAQPSSYRRMREHIIESLTVQNPSYSALRNQAFIKALILGDKSEITSEQWQLLQNSGTIHLMAISGLHIGLIAGITFIVISLLVKPLSLLISLNILRFIPLSLSMAASTFYAALAGFSTPTLRALILVLVFGLAKLLFVRTSFMSVLLLSACFLLALNPLLILQAGFALSYCAVAVLIVSFSERIETRGRFRTFVWAQVVLLVGLALPLSVLNLPISGLAPLANSLAIPLISVLVLPLLLAGAILSFVHQGAAHFFYSLADHCLDFLAGCLRFLSSPDATFYLSNLPFVSLIALLVLVVFFLMPRGFALRWPSIALAIIVVAQLVRNPNNSELKLTVLDVGQGLSVVLEDKGQLLVYDVGARFSDSFDIGDRVLAPFIKTHGYSGIDNVVISHSDNDHAGGLTALAKQINIKHLYSSQHLPDTTLTYEPCKEFSFARKLISEIESGPFIAKGMPAKVPEGMAAEAQASVQKGMPAGISIKLQHLWPRYQFDDPEYKNQSANDGSCVILLDLQGVKILLTGDIEARVEAFLVASEELIDIDVLIAPHHGSATSSSKRFIESLTPEHVIFSAGYRNRYHHPSSTIQERYRELNVRQWNTATMGAIQLQIGLNGQYSIHAERCRSWRDWLDTSACTE
jgi:competence protein ComEC